MTLLDHLRPPAVSEPGALAYKEWLHCNIFDPVSGCVGLVNLALHGPPGDHRSRAVAAALLHVPSSGWAGDLAVHDVDDCVLGLESMALPEAGLFVNPLTGAVDVSARFSGLTLRFSAKPEASPLTVEQAMPFGGGWISWTAAPRMALVGTAELGGHELRLEGAAAYHDHNWGRWRWGDDVGWEWGCFQASADGPALVEGDGRGPWSCRTIVVARTTDRSHRVLRPAIAAVGMYGRRLLFTGPSVSIEWSGRLDAPLRRVPGALAALHADRARPRLPAALRVRAEDGVSHLVVDFTAVSAAQVIVADPFQRGYGFIHELAGSYSCRGRLCGRSVEAEGLAIVEYVR